MQQIVFKREFSALFYPIKTENAQYLEECISKLNLVSIGLSV